MTPYIHTFWRFVQYSERASKRTGGCLMATRKKNSRGWKSYDTVTLTRVADPAYVVFANADYLAATFKQKNLPFPPQWWRGCWRWGGSSDRKCRNPCTTTTTSRLHVIKKLPPFFGCTFEAAIFRPSRLKSVATYLLLTKWGRLEKQRWFHLSGDEIVRSMSLFQ